MPNSMKCSKLSDMMWRIVATKGSYYISHANVSTTDLKDAIRVDRAEGRKRPVRPFLPWVFDIATKRCTTDRKLTIKKMTIQPFNGAEKYD